MNLQKGDTNGQIANILHKIFQTENLLAYSSYFVSNMRKNYFSRKGIILDIDIIPTKHIPLLQLNNHLFNFNNSIPVNIPQSLISEGNFSVNFCGYILSINYSDMAAAIDHSKKIIYFPIYFYNNDAYEIFEKFPFFLSQTEYDSVIGIIANRKRKLQPRKSNWKKRKLQ